MIGQNTGNKIPHCRRCGTNKKITYHHIFPRRYLVHLPNYWKRGMTNNLIPICRKCHDKFENKVYSWYLKVEDSIKNTIKHERLQKINSKYNGAVTHHIKAKPKKVIESLKNDRQIYKFIIIVRYQFLKFLKQPIKSKIISKQVTKNCDSSLTEYLLK